ncbi:MAG: putative transcriptional regulator, TetR family [Acidimicrobiales bacterium]|nr:putative transcriptional regulator, TetR family [Acidimicrobiales bacterium]
MIVHDAPVRAQRATALPPDERRAAIISATLPLLLEHGSAVTTRMIANAASIAEGTIFRVFPDKDSLIAAAVDQAFDPAPMEAALAEIDPAAPFEQRLALATAIVQQRTQNIWRLATTVGVDKVPTERRRPTDVPGLVALFASAADQLDRDPVDAARLLRALTLAVTHPALIHDDPMSPDEIVSLLLDGIRRKSPAPRTR